MVKKRIIPCLDVDNGRVVKGTNFINIKDAGDPIELAKKYESDGADELVFLDITASSDKRIIIKELVQRVAKEIFIPFTVGGGINSIEMIQDILNLGADKVSLNTAALHSPNLIKEASNHFGSQCIVVAIDTKRMSSSPAPTSSSNPMYSLLSSDHDSIAEVYSHGGRKNLGIDVLKWISYCEAVGAGEILLTSMDSDGTQCGYDTDLLAKVKSISKLPLIASGGAGSTEDIFDALKIADAALLASILHYNISSIDMIKSELCRQKMDIRI